MRTLNYFFISVVLTFVLTGSARAASTASKGSGNWNNAAIWTNGVPGVSDVVTITAGDTVTVNVNTAKISGLTIQAGAVVRGDGTGKNFWLGKGGGEDFTNNGTIIARGAQAMRVILNRNSQWGGTGVFQLGLLDLNLKTLSFTAGSSFTVKLNASPDPIQNPGVITPAAGVGFAFDGTSAQNLSSGAGVGYYDLVIDNPAGVTLKTNLTTTTLQGNLSLTAGSLLATSDGVSAFSISGNGANTMTLGANATLQLGSTASAASGFPAGFLSYNVNETSTVDYANNSTAVQEISLAATYGNIHCGGSGGHSLAAGTLTLNGNWSRDGSGALTVSSPNTVVFGAGASSAKTIGGSASTAFDNLTVNNASGISLGVGTTVNGTLALGSQVVSTGANILAIGASGSVARTTGYVNGNLQKYAPAGPAGLTFEVGDASSYAPVDVAFANVTLAGDLVVSTTAAEHPAIGASYLASSKDANRYWTVAGAGVGFTSYDVTLHYVSADVDAGATTGNFGVNRYGTPTWYTLQTGTRTATSTQALGVTSFGDFAVGELQLFNISAGAGANGSISPSGIVAVAGGTNQSFAITPAAGYHVADVLVDGSSVGAVTSYNFTSVGANHTIAASFGVDQFTITATADSNGSISPGGSVGVSSGTNQLFTMTPSTGYHVLDVKVDGSSVGAVGSYNFVNITSNHTISVSFAIDQFTINATAGPNGSIAPGGSTVVTYGGSAGYTITPNAGYYVADVHVDSVSVGRLTGYTFTNVTANHTIEATFALIQYTINASAGANGTITPEGSVLVDHGASQGFSITPNTGYFVSDVHVDSVSVGQVTSYTFTNVTADHTIQAFFAITQYKVTAVAGAHGAITPSGSTVANYGDSLAYAITADSGYYIADVQVDTVSVGAVTHYTFTNISAHHVIAAAFTQILNPVPVLSSISPASGYRGDTLDVTYRGRHFINGVTTLPLASEIGGGGFTILADTVLVHHIVVGANASLGAHGFYVTNAQPGGGNSDTVSFTVLNHLPSAARLSVPASGDTLVVESLGANVRFAWNPSADPDVMDSLKYSIRLHGPGIDSVVAGLTDTTLQWGVAAMLQSGGSYWWTVSVTDGHGTVASPDTFTFHVTSLTAVRDQGKDLPKVYALFQNFPNPFNPTTVVRFDLPRASEVRITVYNLIGQQVAVLVDQSSMGAGHHEVTMDAGALSSGVYLYRITAKAETGDVFSSVRKMVLVK